MARSYITDKTIDPWGIGTLLEIYRHAKEEKQNKEKSYVTANLDGSVYKISPLWRKNGSMSYTKRRPFYFTVQEPGGAYEVHEGYILGGDELKGQKISIAGIELDDGTRLDASDAVAFLGALGKNPRAQDFYIDSAIEKLSGAGREAPYYSTYGGKILKGYGNSITDNAKNSLYANITTNTTKVPDADTISWASSGGEPASTVNKIPVQTQNQIPAGTPNEFIEAYRATLGAIPKRK